MKCYHCQGNCTKAGLRRGRQMLRCKSCHKYRMLAYINKGCDPTVTPKIATLLAESCGKRSICRILKLCMNTILSKIRSYASTVNPPACFEQGLTYEMDELHTYIGSKKQECWIIYALERQSKKVVAFSIGRHSSENIAQVTQKVSRTAPKVIYSDKLNTYPALIPANVHQVRKGTTNSIERYNLTLRTHLKRLDRKTICISKSTKMLECCLMIYFWRDRTTVSWLKS